MATNNILVNMSTNELVNDLYAAKCSKQVNEAIQLYLNRLFHESNYSKTMKYNGTRVSIYFIGKSGLDIEFTAKDGAYYNWAIRYDDETAFGRTNYSDGYFSSTDFPEYVENVLWNLYQVLTVDTGIFQLDKDLDAINI